MNIRWEAGWRCGRTGSGGRLGGCEGERGAARVIGGASRFPV